jgi:glycosyltransferase involved in cell wall biosynthesis
MRLSFVISTYNNPAALDAIFSRLAADSSARPHEVVIADDGSGPATRAVIEKWAKLAPFQVKHAWQEDRGFRKSLILNAAIAMTEGEYLVFLDGDCLPAPRFAADHAALAESGTFVQGRRAFVDESKVADLLAGQVSLGRLILTGHVHGLLKAMRWPVPVIQRNQGQRGLIGCNLAIWRQDLVAVNGYDESYEGWGKEDSDLGARLYHLGRERKFVYGRAIVYHLNHPPASRAQLPDAEKRLDEALSTRRIKALRGLEQHQPAR